MPNGVEPIELYLACFQAGWYLTPINNHLAAPEIAYIVDDCEAKAFVAAWRRAGAKLTPKPNLDSRWTIECFCGRETAAGAVDTKAVVGMPFLTGSKGTPVRS